MINWQPQLQRERQLQRGGAASPGGGDQVREVAEQRRRGRQPAAAAAAGALAAQGVLEAELGQERRKGGGQLDEGAVAVGGEQEQLHDRGRVEYIVLRLRRGVGYLEKVSLIITIGMFIG